MTPKDEPLKLLPCPFCGGDAFRDTEEIGIAKYLVGCSGSPCLGYQWGRTREEADRNWNTRRALPLTEQERESLAWADEVVIYEPGAKRGHLKAAVLAALVRRLTSHDKEKP